MGLPKSLLNSLGFCAWPVDSGGLPAGVPNSVLGGDNVGDPVWRTTLDYYFGGISVDWYNGLLVDSYGFPALTWAAGEIILTAPLFLNNTFSASVFAATGYIIIYDSSGNAYKVACAPL